MHGTLTWCSINLECHGENVNLLGAVWHTMRLLHYRWLLNTLPMMLSSSFYVYADGFPHHDEDSGLLALDNAWQSIGLYDHLVTYANPRF